MPKFQVEEGWGRVQVAVFSTSRTISVKRSILQQKLLLTAYMKSYMSYPLVAMSMTLGAL